MRWGSSRNYQKTVKTAVVVLFSFVLVVFFQNCGQSGFDQVDSASIDGSTVNSKFQSAPVPVSMNFNQIAFMSCPAIGQNPRDPEPLNNPYFTLRGGGFDNDKLLKIRGAAGGIGVSKDAVDYVRNSISSAASPQSIAYFVRSSPHTNNKIPTLAVISRARSKDKPSSLMLAAPFLDVLSNQYFGISLGSAPVASSGVPNKVQFFSQAQFGKRSFIGDLNAADSDSIQRMIDGSELSGNTYFFLGLANAGSVGSPEKAIPSLAGPDGDFTKRLFGRGYTFRFTNRDRKGIDSCEGSPWIPCLKNNTDSYSANAITEYDFNPNSGSSTVAMDPVDLTSKEKQVWNCMNFGIVRHVDRYYNRALQSLSGPQGGGNGWSAGPGAVLPKAYVPAPGTAERVYFKSENEVTQVDNSIQWANNPALFQPGRYAACPPQSVTELDTPEQRDMLQIARRFLPADLWEINLKLRCVVPTRKAESLGRCYAVGDTDIGTYVRYRGNAGPCGKDELGRTVDECPAFVSICYRR